MNKQTWVVKETGRYEDYRGTISTVSKNGEIVGEMNYLEAQEYVMEHGDPADVYIEEYVGGLPPVTVTVQYVIDQEKKWKETLQSLEQEHGNLE